MCFEQPVQVSTCWEAGGRTDLIERLTALSECCLATVPDITAPEDFTDVGFPAGVPERCEIAWARRENGALYVNTAGGDPDEWQLIFDPNAASARLPGEIIDYAGTSEPPGWLLCDGRAVSRETYSTLFVVIGTNYGVGDGSTTFNLPDLRGRVSVGKDDMGGIAANRVTGGDVMGANGGAEDHLLVTAQIPSHSHQNQTRPSGSGTNRFPITNDGQGTGTATVAFNSGNTGGSGTHNNMQPYQIVNKLIKI